MDLFIFNACFQTVMYLKIIIQTWDKLKIILVCYLNALKIFNIKFFFKLVKIVVT